MEKELSVVNETTAAVADTFNYKEKALEYLSSMGNKLPQKQQTQFLELSQALKLNPFKREIYAVGYGDNWNIITGYEVYIKRAERTGKLNGWKVTVEGSGENMTATVTIHRKDFEYPFEHTVLFSEVCQKTKDGKLNSVWSKMPSFMTKKVAIAQGFRLCFSDELSGMPYTADEMPSTDDLKDVTPKTEKLAEEATTNAKPKIAKKLYTKEQAAELGEIMNATFEKDGSPIFTQAEKDQYKEMLVNGLFDDALSSAKELLTKRVTGEVPLF